MGELKKAEIPLLCGLFIALRYTRDKGQRHPHMKEVIERYMSLCVERYISSEEIALRLVFIAREHGFDEELMHELLDEIGGKSRPHRKLSALTTLREALQRKQRASGLARRPRRSGRGRWDLSRVPRRGGTSQPMSSEPRAQAWGSQPKRSRNPPPLPGRMSVGAPTGG
jgi:hypothetical protein